MRRLALLSLLVSTALGCGGGLTSGGGGSRVSPALLRKNTVSVYVEAPDRIAALFDGIAQRLQAKGKTQIAHFFAAQTGGSFGSGFAIRKDGETFVVTNRHVVDFADEAVVVLDGSDRPYAVEVLYADRLYDLAVLAFQEPPPSDLSGLRLSTDKVRDLETVVATGFPGLDGKPSYQVTKGQVSNEKFVAQTRGQPIALIQHTAPIDPGSSGGPLTGESGAVVGVNFIKYTGRDNVYLAIPADAVETVLKSASETRRGRKSMPWLVEHLSEACGRLVGGLRHPNEPSVDVFDLITNDVVAEKGFESLDAMARSEKDVWPAFFENPTAVMRIAVSVRLWKEAHGQQGLPVSCLPLEQDPNATSVRLLVKFEHGDRETFWRFEQGAWKLAGFDRIVPSSRPPPRKR